jgi:hypothetical protein
VYPASELGRLVFSQGEGSRRRGSLCQLLTCGMSSADREAALWEMEEHQLQERHQLVKQQLKDQYFLQRHELLRKHEKVGWGQCGVWHGGSWRDSGVQCGCGAVWHGGTVWARGDRVARGRCGPGWPRGFFGDVLLWPQSRNGPASPLAPECSGTLLLPLPPSHPI